MDRNQNERSRRVAFWSRDDMYCETGKRFSLLMFILIGIVWVLRRLSVFELSKRVLWRNSETPAWYLDAYLMLLWSGTAIVILLFDNDLPSKLTRIIFLLIITQVVQTSFYHELWRPIRLTKAQQTINITYSRLRNLIIGFGNFVYVTCLYGLVYWKSGNAFGNSFPFYAPGDAIYFSFTVAWTVGSVDIAPGNVDAFVKGTIISQVVVTLFLVSIILATSAGTIITTREMPMLEDEEEIGDKGQKKEGDEREEEGAGS